jgi:hypothetical protein
MALISISGIGRKKANSKKAEKKQARAEKKIVRKAKVAVKKKKILAKIKKVGKVLVKYNPLVATARNSFLVLVQINFLNLAKKLNILLIKNPKKLMKFWTGLSGNFGSLQKAINSGKNRKAILGAVAVATTVATATPILIKVQKFLKESGITAKDIIDVVKPIIAKAVKKKVEEQAEQEVAEEEGQEAEESGTEDSETEDSGTEDSGTEDSETEDSRTEDSGTDDSDTENEQVGYYC